jgi:copper chaperone CopZ
MAQTMDVLVVGEDTIHCAGCERRVGNVIRRLTGIQDVRASAQTQHAPVTVDPEQVGPGAVRARLADRGDEVVSQEEEAPHGRPDA